MNESARYGNVWYHCGLRYSCGISNLYGVVETVAPGQNKSAKQQVPWTYCSSLDLSFSFFFFRR